MALPILQEAAGKIALAGRRTLGTPAPGELRKPSKVLKDGADAVGAVVMLTWGTGSFSKVAVVNRDVKGEAVVSTETLARISAEAGGFGAFLLEPALGSTAPAAAK